MGSVGAMISELQIFLDGLRSGPGKMGNISLIILIIYIQYTPTDNAYCKFFLLSRPMPIFFIIPPTANFLLLSHPLLFFYPAHCQFNFITPSTAKFLNYPDHCQFLYYPIHIGYFIFLTHQLPIFYFIIPSTKIFWGYLAHCQFYRN